MDVHKSLCVEVVLWFGAFITGKSGSKHLKGKGKGAVKGVVKSGAVEGLL